MARIATDYELALRVAPEMNVTPSKAEEWIKTFRAELVAGADEWHYFHATVQNARLVDAKEEAGIP